jgi:hypothetical protein
MESSFFFRGRWRVAFFSLYRCITEASSPGPPLPLVAALHRSNNSRASPLRPSRQQNEPTHAHTGGVRARIAPPHEAVVPILLSPKKKKLVPILPSGTASLPAASQADAPLPLLFHLAPPPQSNLVELREPPPNAARVPEDSGDHRLNGCATRTVRRRMADPGNSRLELTRFTTYRRRLHGPR